MTRLIKASDFGTTVSVDLAELTGEDEEDADISVYYIPVLYDSEYSPVGPKSPTSTVSAQPEEPEPEGYPFVEEFGHELMIPTLDYQYRKNRLSDGSDIEYDFALGEKDFYDFCAATEKLPNCSIRRKEEYQLERERILDHLYYFPDLIVEVIYNEPKSGRTHVRVWVQEYKEITIIDVND